MKGVKERIKKEDGKKKRGEKGGRGKGERRGKLIVSGG